MAEQSDQGHLGGLSRLIGTRKSKDVIQDLNPLRQILHDAVPMGKDEKHKTLDPKDFSAHSPTFKEVVLTRTQTVAGDHLTSDYLAVFTLPDPTKPIKVLVLRHGAHGENQSHSLTVRPEDIPDILKKFELNPNNYEFRAITDPNSEEGKKERRATEVLLRALKRAFETQTPQPTPQEVK